MLKQNQEHEETITKEELRFISPLYDTTIKYLFKNENCKKWLSKLIKHVTGEDLYDYKMYDTEINTGNNKRDYRLDILFLKGNEEIKKADLMNIEMYKTYYEYNDVKSRTYMHKLMSDGYESGDTFTRRHGIQVNFLNYCHDTYKDVCICKLLMHDEYHSDIRDDEVIVYNVYLSNYRNVCYNSGNELEAMLSLLKASSYDAMRDIACGNEEALTIVKELEKLSTNEEFIGLYDAEELHKKELNSARSEGIDIGIEQGIERGIERGIDEEKLNTAKRMLKKSFTIDVISEMTELSIEDIKKISEEMN